jgi:hypothetical protein
MLSFLSIYFSPKCRVFLFIIIISSVISCHRYSLRKTNSSIIQSEQQPDLKLCVDQLDDKLRENSGIIFYRDYLWTINDNGGKPVIYAFHPGTGKIVQTVSVVNARNRDWEDIAQDNDYIYVGDFGNNYGEREKLYIYRIKKKDIPVRRNDDVKAKSIRFSYENMPEGKSGKQRSSFDCEAFFAWHDSLYLFTKNWDNQTTTCYAVPAKPGEYVIKPKQSYDSDGLITGADIDHNGKYVVLSGYKDYIPFLLIFYDIHMPDIFSGKMRRLEFPEFFDLQTEGVAIRSPKVIYISSERSSLPPGLYRIDLNGILSGE